MSEPTAVITVPVGVLRRAAVLAGALVGAVVVFLLLVTLVRAIQGQDPLASSINPQEYQAVFLTNGQVYFGRLTIPGGDFYYLRDIYYLSSQASPQSGKPARPTLIKLGSEIHGPEDMMVINRSQILFVENLKPNGKVSKAIRSSGG